MLKSLALYAALITAAFGIQHVLEKMSRDADSPILQIARANAAQPFGAQISQAHLSAIMAKNAATITADKSALAQAEQGVAP